MTASEARLDLNANALTVLERRDLVKDDQGKPVEHPRDLFWRVARTIAAPDRTYGPSDRAVESLAETFFGPPHGLGYGDTGRGAHMGTMRVDHPDIMAVIHCQDDLTQVTNYNISVAVTDAFMVALEAGKPYDLIHPPTCTVVCQLDA